MNSGYDGSDFALIQFEDICPNFHKQNFYIHTNSYNTNNKEQMHKPAFRNSLQQTPNLDNERIHCSDLLDKMPLGNASTVDKAYMHLQFYRYQF